MVLYKLPNKHSNPQFSYFSCINNAITCHPRYVSHRIYLFFNPLFLEWTTLHINKKKQRGEMKCNVYVKVTKRGQYSVRIFNFLQFIVLILSCSLLFIDMIGYTTTILNIGRSIDFEKGTVLNWKVSSMMVVPFISCPIIWCSLFSSTLEIFYLFSINLHRSGQNDD